MNSGEPMRRTYRENMTAEDRAALLADCDALDLAYASAAEADAPQAAIDATHPEELDAAVEQSGDYFNRYIAGDRR